MVKKVYICGNYKDLSQEIKEDIARLGKMLAQNCITVMSSGFGGIN